MVTRRLLYDAVEIVGVGCLVYAGWQIWAPVAWIIAGLALVAIGNRA